MITSFRHDEWKKKRRNKILGIIFVIALVLFSVRGPVASLLGGTLVFIGRPFWSFKGSEKFHSNLQRKWLAARVLRCQPQEIAIICH